jgi:hypothetical protein
LVIGMKIISSQMKLVHSWGLGRSSHKFQCCSANINQHPLVHQLGIPSIAWGGIFHLVLKSTLTIVHLFLVLTITCVFFLC